MTFATASLTPIFTNCLIASRIWTPNWRNGFVSPVTLLHTLASSRSRLLKNKNHYQDLVFSSCSRGFSCQSTALSDVNSPSHTVSSNGHLMYGRLLPCPLQNSPPRVEHLVVTKEGPVLDYISKALDLPPLYVEDLIQFGAVYYALVCPKPPPTATAEQIKVYEEVTDPSVLRKRTSIKGKTVREAQKTFRITHADDIVETGTYLRVHVHPKRFPRCYDIDWKSRIIAVTDDYVILDKPAGTSVGGTTDNIEESCATFATRALGFSAPLQTTHQIDNCTEGCVVLARSKEYCSVFHGKIREKKVKKLYLALAAAPVPIGILTHYMRPINMAPRLVSEDFVKGWYLCQLEVLECKKVAWPRSEIESTYNIEDCGWPLKDFAYECQINLLTGRTHQIRAQLAACSAPVVGDAMYMPAAIAEMVSPGSNPLGKNKKLYTNENDKSLAIDEWIAQHGKEPSVAIGLQACQISWDDGEHCYEARSPWWR
ncbi:RNA pseudouridine synthase 6, chloroplastic [Nicotiana tomentosiformis]|uniref:RNA pseudouridine synthase 6, chloroplastic n=1 Tax=Nicotiana tomentosiformis TaxID=4098 RepID=UPI00051B4E91|nr:RNA pseudouridine synthase 6, chloroplastic [Nicotiana tomentosiformis]XP_033517015.1 RNA pseudouridine synthase 6, chloroplastic [Nicotiana tomentosiformis]